MQPQPHESSKQVSPSESSPNPLLHSQDGYRDDTFYPPQVLRDCHRRSSSGALLPVSGALSQQESVNAGESPDNFSDRLNATVDWSLTTPHPHYRDEHVTPDQEKDGDTVELRIDTRYEALSRFSTSTEDLPNEVLVQVLTHLPPDALSTISLVSRRFYELVTTPHAWRIAFARYFPGQEAITAKRSKDREDALISSNREFTRLTAFATWRSEYTLRPKLLKALERGKPSHVLAPSTSPRSSRISSAQNAAQLTYSSRLLSIVDHLHCSFQAGSNRRSPRAVHGTQELGKASMSDPLDGKVEYWGSGDPQSFDHFDDTHPTEIPYGLGPGRLVGLPNPMDVSQTHGMLLGEGLPGGLLYYRSIQEQRGRVLACSHGEGAPELGIPRVDPSRETICSVWITKSKSVPSISGGVIGLMSGSSHGIVSAYSAGSVDGTRTFAKGELTARWVLSPGVPIIAIAVDDGYNMQRLSKRRIWAVVLNALGEVFYITDLPRFGNPSKGSLSDSERNERAWKTGRSVFWSYVEPTRRTANGELGVNEDGHAAYTPRSSWDGMNLGKQQIAAETHEIEQHLKKTPKQVRELCDGWDMRRRLEVDFAGDDENDAGEAIIIINCGIEDEAKTKITRFKRLKVQNASPSPTSSIEASPSSSPAAQVSSIFGSNSDALAPAAEWSFSALPSSPSETLTGTDIQGSHAKMIDLWRESKFSLGGLKDPTITCTALDLSVCALTTTFEDLRLGMTASNASSPQSTPSTSTPQYTKSVDIVGQRARFLAVGTSLGSIVIWNTRAAHSTTKPVRPLRIISTPDLREISCLALTALYVVHGDTDGVVQAWDPLASTTQPIRTLHSRFSSRHRRQLNEMYGVPQGANINHFAASAIALDPDPTVLRGIVALGTHLHYWSYSTADAAKYKPGKRRLRRSPRGSNQTPDRIGRIGRDQIKDYISKERAELAQEEKAQRKERKRFVGRFGTELLGPDATDAEIMAYATMLSQEAAVNDQARAFSDSASSDNGTEVFSSPVTAASAFDNNVDQDLAQAMLLSLHPSGASGSEPQEDLVGPSQGFDLPLRYTKKRGTKSSSGSPPRPKSAAGSSQQPEMDDLEFALQLSRAEAQSLGDWQEEFPALERTSSDETEGEGKGKGRRRS
ncbi:MAG: hypothetical protein MMC23_007581 [Stictis urceolatum]|nr:hypothetical protein [Stictis urceolata]